MSTPSLDNLPPISESLPRSRKVMTGDELAEGSRSAAESVGRSELAMHVKGLEIPGYDPRSLQGMALGFAVGTRGADHNRSGAYELDFSNDVDRNHFDPVHAAKVVEVENRTAAIDSLILCKFLRGVFKDFHTEGATLLLNSPFGPDEVWEKLPESLQEKIVEKNVKLFVIDAYEVASQTGMGRRINTVMQVCFFAISGVLPRDEAMRVYRSRGGIENLAENVKHSLEGALALGQKYLNLPGLGRNDFQSLDQVKGNIERLVEAGEICAREGVLFGYHNHSWELKPIDNLVPYELMLNETDKDILAFQMDAYWIVKGGGDLHDYLGRYPGRFPSCHLKDIDAAGDFDFGFGRQTYRRRCRQPRRDTLTGRVAHRILLEKPPEDIEVLDRDQGRVEIVRDATKTYKKRKPTRPTAGSRKRRMDSKTRHGNKKDLRKKVQLD